VTLGAGWATGLANFHAIAEFNFIYLIFLYFLLCRVDAEKVNAYPEEHNVSRGVGT